MSAEAIRSAIHVVLQSLRSTCHTMHCLCERVFFFSSSYLTHPKIQRPKSCPQMHASSVALDSFQQLLYTQLTSDLTQTWRGWSMLHPLSHIYVKNPFSCVETVANNALNRQRVVVFDRLWANASPTLNTPFSLTDVHAKWWIHCLPISSTPLLSHTFSIYDRPKRVCRDSFGVFRDIYRIWTTALKVSTPPLNRCFQRSKALITLSKSHCFAWTVFFSHQKAMLYHHTKFRFFYCIENLQQ